MSMPVGLSEFHITILYLRISADSW